MGHDSGRRTEQLKIATLTARDEAARDAAGPRHRREVVRRPRRRQAPAVLPDAGGSIPGSPAVAPAVLSGLPAAARDRPPEHRPAPDFPIMALRAALVCETMCRGGGPPPQLLGLERVPFDHGKRTAEDER